MKSSTSFAIGASAGASPSELSDAELLAATRSLVGRSNQLLANLLAHLAELEARGIHRTRACSSLYVYCVYELRLSEDEAYRRVAAARLVRRFPPLLTAIAAGELHLTGLLLLGPHLTEDNLAQVLVCAKHRTKKEIARLVRQLDPLPDVPSRIEPLGPAPARLVPEAPTWAEFVASLCPVRELAPGERPRDWTESVVASMAKSAAESMNDVDVYEDGSKPAQSVEPDVSEQPAPARIEAQRYCVQFTASEEYVRLVEEVQALLSHSIGRTPLEELHLRAMRALAAELKRQKYAVTAKPRGRPSSAPPAAARAPEARNDAGGSGTTDEPESESGPGPESAHPRRRGRYIPAAVRCAIFERDQARCTYADASGRRCPETHLLELHHLKAFALGGAHTEENLTLRCRAHNALAAEQDFGKDFIAHQRDSNEHERWRSRRAGP